MNPIFYIEGDELGVVIDGKSYQAAPDFLREINAEFSVMTAKLKTLDADNIKLRRMLADAQEDSIRLDVIRDLVGAR